MHMAEKPAAFGRLCVETRGTKTTPEMINPAAFGRLCVETLKFESDEFCSLPQPPSGGCVLKQPVSQVIPGWTEASRLRAAVC